ncbi:MAG TPA: SDR family NAD(P)-dependent oxidoreductase [Anaerolineae bacterium]|nr:SDR family NAD(P)-dependent oxidoreductase [Anaerolineae bacterium]
MTNVISTASQIGLEEIGAYAATKWGLLGLTKCLINEARPYNVRVTAFSPGGTDTSFRAAPRPHYLAPDTVAEAILLIASLPENAVVHDLVLRPIVETNF